MKTRPDRRPTQPVAADAVFMRKLVLLAVLIYIAILLAAAQAHAAQPIEGVGNSVPSATDVAPTGNPPQVPPIVVVRMDLATGVNALGDALES